MEGNWKYSEEQTKSCKDDGGQTRKYGDAWYCNDACNKCHCHRDGRWGKTEIGCSSGTEYPLERL